MRANFTINSTFRTKTEAAVWPATDRVSLVFSLDDCWKCIFATVSQVETRFQTSAGDEDLEVSSQWLYATKCTKNIRFMGLGVCEMSFGQIHTDTQTHVIKRWTPPALLLEEIIAAFGKWTEKDRTQIDASTSNTHTHEETAEESKTPLWPRNHH